MHRRTFLAGSALGLASPLLPVSVSAQRRLQMTQHRITRLGRLDPLATALIASPEFQTRLRTHPTEDLAGHLYHALTGHPTTEATVQGLTARVPGAGWPQIMGQLLRSVEVGAAPTPKVIGRVATSTLPKVNLAVPHVRLLVRYAGRVDRLYDGLLDRPPSQYELARAVWAYAQYGTSVRVVQSSFLSRADAETNDESATGMVQAESAVAQAIDASLAAQGFTANDAGARGALSFAAARSLTAAAAMGRAGSIVGAQGLSMVAQGLVGGGVIATAANIGVAAIVSLTGVTMMALGVVIFIATLNFDPNAPARGSGIDVPEPSGDGTVSTSTAVGLSGVPGTQDLSLSVVGEGLSDDGAPSAGLSDGTGGDGSGTGTGDW